ncbi:phospho-N-acetylmuramoyl-pentapeptide-transferase [endosymbiont of Euscepes postfasciatus]|uniref:phospho-N-acetylmuramoyl-pentapeptide- transferase n=1 Tax=endosymbiont of Euscepes postfasciatus TaxID=650377 RepID=UPI000DC70C4B|nr:phospho-N-acetylmuramoyl-pentapeptide-transferase [endosymbiont of Euscepes postfasciatus]BBA84554.1 phospho-N-acetylmuramoyl-pentapeptide-transferase [endosymbiont of Euscepes postfasciatus]
MLINIFFVLKNIKCFLLSFLISIFFGYIYLYISKNNFNYIQKSKNINNILDKNIPTFGGVYIILSIIISILITLEINYLSLLIIISLFFYGILGFIDDFIKTYKYTNKNGLSKKYKFFFQTIITIIILFYLYMNKKEFNYTILPFFGIYNIYNNIYIYYIFLYIIIISTSNAINITDGIDGLCIKNIIYILCFFIFSSYINIKFYNFLYIDNIININLIFLGSCLSFLWFNCYPAQIFLGDTGSLSLGSSISIISILLNKEFFLLINGIIFVLETVSVIIQIIFFNFFLKKKIFLMSPLHHHYQLKKINDCKIVERLSIISIIFNIIALLSIIII